MHFLRYLNSLWFWQAGQGETGTTSFVVSAQYNISLSAHPVTSAQIELSAFLYNATISAASQSTLVYLSADGLDGGYERLNCFATITPVFVLSQSGQFSHSVSAAYKATISAETGSIAAYLTVAPTYGISASLSTALLISDQYSVSAAYLVTASTAFVLSKTIEAQLKEAAIECKATASITAALVIDRGGGLVWSRQQQAYIPQRVGFPI